VIIDTIFTTEIGASNPEIGASNPNEWFLTDAFQMKVRSLKRQLDERPREEELVSQAASTRQQKDELQEVSVQQYGAEVGTKQLNHSLSYHYYCNHRSMS